MVKTICRLYLISVRQRAIVKDIGKCKSLIGTLFINQPPKKKNYNEESNEILHHFENALSVYLHSWMCCRGSYLRLISAASGWSCRYLSLASVAACSISSLCSLFMSPSLQLKFFFFLQKSH